MEPLPNSPQEPAAPGPPGSAQRESAGTVVVPSRRRFAGFVSGLRSVPRAVWIGVAAFVALLWFAWAGTGYVYEPLVDRPPTVAGEVPGGEARLKTAVARLRARERQFTARLEAASPRGVFIVVDQTHNRIYLRKGDEVLLEAVCSAGSGMVLKESGGKKREWVFDTPRGRFEVLSMAERPVWRKPDWAFVEEGQPIPKNPAERLEYGTLGEYALYFGNGYMIHGTLYERLLGRAVSHGCIRVGRDDLRKVWANARLGTPIFIY